MFVFAVVGGGGGRWGVCWGGGLVVGLRKGLMRVFKGFIEGLVRV